MKNDSTATQTLSSGKEPVSVQHHIRTQSIYSGPLPSADEMRKYADIFPDLPQKIFEMAKAEQAHRFAMESATSNRADEELKINSRCVVIGMATAVFIVLIIMTAAVLCAKFGHPVASGFIGTGGVVLIVSTIITGAKIRSR